MLIRPDGFMVFDDVFELTYELLNEMELEVQPNGYIYDRIHNNVYSFNGLMIKASTDPMNIHYAGQGEIAFDILHNTKMMKMMFENFIAKKQAEEMPFLSFYPDEQEIEATKKGEEDYKVSMLTVKFDTYHSISTPFYYRNPCLKFIHMIFLLEETQVDLRNFDIPEV